MKPKSTTPLNRPAIVLVVDDEPLIRQIERRTLELEDRYSVLEAEGGADLEMPDVPGEEMVRQIRSARPDLKVLYVTGHIDRLLNVRSTLWEGEAFLDKPFTSQGLLEAVSLLLYGTLKGRAG
jgi:DNA-binding NtrC family response regulator